MTLNANEEPRSSEPSEPSSSSSVETSPQSPPTPATASGPAEPGKPPGIRYTDRVLVLGQNGSGKSVLLNFLFSTGYRCQRFLLDTKDEFLIPGVDRVSKIDHIDWDAPIIHYVDDRGDLKEYDRLFRTLHQRRSGRVEGPRNYGIVVCCHELADLCGDQPGATPPWVSAYIRKGRAHGQGLLAGSQRPVCMPKAARTEAHHVFAFAEGFDPDDRPVVAKLVQLNERQLEHTLAQAAAKSPTGEHAYIWFDKRQKRIQIRPPLPEQLRARSFVKGIDP